MGLDMTATQALGLWHRVTLDQVLKDGHDLTMRQLAVLLETLQYVQKSCFGVF